MAISTQRKVPPRPPRHKPVDRQTLSQNAIPSIAKIRDLIKKVTSALGGTNFAVGVVTCAEGPITAPLGVRRVTVGLAGVSAGQNYLALPAAALPAGFGILDCICTQNNRITIGLLVPEQAAGSYSFNVRVVRIET